MSRSGRETVTFVKFRVLAGLVAAVVVWAEVDAWCTARADYPAQRVDGPGDDVVLVLGYPSRRDGRAGLLQRWRTRIARRSAPADPLYVFTGGAVRGEIPEAVVMAAYGERLGLTPDRIARETRATTTRENLALSMPWLRDARSIRIASDTHHARRARGYLRASEPHLWARLAPTADFRPLELGPFRPVLTVYNLLARRVADRRDAARAVTPASRAASAAA